MMFYRIEAAMFFVFLLFVVLPLAESGAEEPMCSKFSYDEALLEKMIRNEVKFEKLQSEFMELREEIKTILETFQANVQDKLNKTDESLNDFQDAKQKAESEHRKEVKTVLETFQANIQDKLNTLEEGLRGIQDEKQRRESEHREEIKKILETLQANVQDKLNTVEEGLKGIQDKNQKRESTTPIVGFKATSVSNLSPSPGEVLIFPTVLLNKGNGYNDISGIFTAPVSGLYLLTVQTCTALGRNHAASIMVQGKEMGRLFTQDHDWSVCNSGNAIAYMERNGEAYIKTRHIYGTLNYDSHRMISFAGALLN